MLAELYCFQLVCPSVRCHGHSNLVIFNRISYIDYFYQTLCANCGHNVVFTVHLLRDHTDIGKVFLHLHPSQLSIMRHQMAAHL